MRGWAGHGPWVLKPVILTMVIIPSRCFQRKGRLRGVRQGNPHDVRSTYSGGEKSPGPPLRGGNLQARADKRTVFSAGPTMTDVGALESR